MIELILIILFLFILFNNTLFQQKEFYGDGAIGPFSYSTGAYAYANRPERVYQSQRLKFRYLADDRNW